MTERALLEAHSAGVQDALEAGADGYTLEDVIRQVEAREARLWVNGASGLVTKTQRVEHTGRLEVLVWLGWGTIPELTELMQDVEAWARDRGGIHRLLVVGRLGWMRSALTKVVGFRPRYVMYDKEL